MAEARLREMQAKLFQVARRNTMDSMAAVLVHELNQPLTAAANFADAARRLLAHAGTDAERLASARAAMVEATEQVARAGQILQRLREFLGGDDGGRNAADINVLVTKAVALALADARDHGIKARLDLHPGPPPVLADGIQIEQVVVNLVRNAAEALRGAQRRELVVATAVPDPAWVECSVADTGPGLAEAVAGRLFEPFVTTKHDGMGMGLAICRYIVERHGGHLAAAANPGGGMVFRFAIPSLPTAASGTATDAG